MQQGDCAKLNGLLHRLQTVIKERPKVAKQDHLQVGVDLGTSSVVVVVEGDEGVPVAGAVRYAEVVRDGVVTDYWGAVEIVRELKQQLEASMEQGLTMAATAFPPGVPPADRRATGNVLEAAGLDVVTMLDEVSAANQVLGVTEGVVVDVGGGSTGVGIFREGKLIYAADEPTGGKHLSLVIAGGLRVELEEAEALKCNPERQAELFPMVRPVMEKMALIIKKHIHDFQVKDIFLVGGSVSFPGFRTVVQEITGLPTSIPVAPLLVTPLGIANSCKTFL